MRQIGCYHVLVLDIYTKIYLQNNRAQIPSLVKFTTPVVNTALY